MWSEVLFFWRYWNNDWKESVGFDLIICLCFVFLYIVCVVSDCYRLLLIDWEEKLESEIFLFVFFIIEWYEMLKYI